LTGSADGGGEERQERTALASDRTLLASERTLAAWWRTAIAAALVQLYGEVQPDWLVRAAASAAIALALLVLFVGARRYATTARRVESAFVDRVPRAEIWIGTGLLSLLAVAAAVIVWFGG
jgi:putative membrane protein